MVRGYFFYPYRSILLGGINIFPSITFRQGLEPLEAAFWRALFAWFCFGATIIISAVLITIKAR